mgnify:CR=1 FL=1
MAIENIDKYDNATSIHNQGISEVKHGALNAKSETADEKSETANTKPETNEAKLVSTDKIDVIKLNLEGEGTFIYLVKYDETF